MNIKQRVTSTYLEGLNTVLVVQTECIRWVACDNVTPEPPRVTTADLMHMCMQFLCGRQPTRTTCDTPCSVLFYFSPGPVSGTMDSYTVMLCAERAGDGLLPRLDAVLHELRTAVADSDAAGAAFVALVGPSGSSRGGGSRGSGGSPDWRRLKDDTDPADLESAGRVADVCAALDSLADRLPDRDVSVNVVWLCGSRLPPAERGGLLAALLRWRLWHGALVQLRPVTAGAGGDCDAGGHLATWRRLLDADDSAPLRPTLRLRLHLPAGSPTTAVRLQGSCGASAWERLTETAAAVHDSSQPAALSLLDGAEVVAEVAADSVPPAALTDCRLRLRRLGAAARARCGWGSGRTALLVRLITAPAGDGDRRRDAEDWRRMAADGRPPDRRAPPAAARLIHFIVTAAEDGSGEGLMTLLAPEAVVAPSRRPPELSLSELQALAADGSGWTAAADIVSRLSGATEEPSCWPERRGLAHWQDVQRRVVPAAARPSADSLVLDADGILGALCGLTAPETAATGPDDSPRRLAEVPWPAAADERGPGVYYNTSAAAEDRELRAARLRERSVAAETACTCSVWRSDAVSVSKAAPTAAPRSSPRRRPAPGAASSRPVKPQQPAAAAAAAGRSRQSDFKHRLGKAIHAALSERGVGTKDVMFRSCARKLATIVRAYLQDVEGAGETSAREMLKLARVHVQHVIKVQRKLQSAV